MILSDTIAAISSAVGDGARIIVRVSGATALEFAKRIAVEALPEPSFARRCRLRFAGMTVPATVYVFAGPRSYTGQDVVEFHLPGNALLARLLLEALLEVGARAAEPGEFTARAYFAGKIDLSEAEGVAATIAAGNEQELRAARQLRAGELSRRLSPYMQMLTETVALVEAGIDFSDEGILFISAEEIGSRVGQIDRGLEELVRGSARFERLTHEPHFVLVGRPNAGKSSLLNALAGYERAIVSPTPGTTRDTLSVEVILGRGLVRVTDTAGLEDTIDDSAHRDIATKMRWHALRAVESADFVIQVHDLTDDRGAPELSRPADLVVRTKLDLVDRAPTNELAVSVVTGVAIEALRRRMDELAFGTLSAAPALALNARHIGAVEHARQALAHGLGHVAEPELLAVDLREALDALGQILGRVTADDVLGHIFARFCIGK